MGLIRRNFALAYGMLSDPAKTLAELRSEKANHALGYLLMIGAVTAFLTPLRSIRVSRISMVFMQVAKPRF